MTSALFSPIKLADLELDNRIVVAPMCQYSADDGVASDWHMTHLGMLANSGAALVVVEMTDVERRGRITHGCLGLYSDHCEAGLARVIAHCKRIGSAKFGVQIAHAGRKASSSRPWEGARSLKPGEDPWETIGPSAIPFGAGWHTPRQMTEEDIAAVREGFVAATRRALRIGFDAIELHMAHGYLIHAFTSPISNKRNDEYGGDLKGRMRFGLEVLRDVRAVVPKGMPLGTRISAIDWLDGGLTIEDSIVWVKAMKDEGLDFVCVSSGGVNAEARLPLDAGFNVPLAETIKRETGVATRAVGLITQAHQSEAIIRDGKADQVALARAVLDDPHWGWHAARELGADVKRPPQYARTAPKLWPGATQPTRAA
jgi:2,4-dienoyl-CoA reductase-like NADH-dependent reductase (Old Yellow Enzyme family)